MTKKKDEKSELNEKKEDFVVTQRLRGEMDGDKIEALFKVNYTEGNLNGKK